MTTTQTSIRQLLDITENSYNNHVIDAGFEFLSRQAIFTPKGRQKMAESRLFWHWWWRNWLACDEAMLKNPLAKMAVAEYLRHHCRAHAYEMPRVMWSKVTLDSDCRMKTKGKLSKMRAR